MSTDDSDDEVCQLSAGDTAFMLFAATVVMMQTPAMGMAQAGMIRRKNSLSMLVQVLVGMFIGSLLWAVCGFSFAFGPSFGSGLIGKPWHYAFLRNVPIDSCIPSMATTIPGIVFCSFQMMFALMTPLVVTGSWVEKMTFEAFLVFVVVWPIVVYYPLVHWVWSPDGWLQSIGVLDFAGGIVIHSNVGVAGFAVSLLLQRRKELTEEAMAHHNLPLSFAGAALVWSGWYSFNGGSALAANYQRYVIMSARTHTHTHTRMHACTGPYTNEIILSIDTNNLHRMFFGGLFFSFRFVSFRSSAGALMNTHLSACAGGMIWSLLNYRNTKKWSMIECVSGAFAGLGGVTAASGFIEPWASIVIGLITATCSFYSVRFFKGYLNLDDVLDVTSLQGTAGIVGSLLVGLFATESMQPNGDINGLFYGGGLHLLKAQFIGCCVVVIWSGTWSFAIVHFMKLTVGIDVPHSVEEIGLDLAQCGEQAYDQRLDLLHDVGHDGLTSLLVDVCSKPGASVDDVKTLVERQHCDPNATDYSGMQAVHHAAAAGNIDIIHYLLVKHMCDLNCVDSNGLTPLHHACRACVVAADSIGEDGDGNDYGNDRALEAVRSRLEVVEWIRSMGGSIVRSEEVEDEIMELVSKPDGGRILLEAYVKAGVDFNFEDYDLRTPLMIAASNGHEDVVMLLLRNAKVDYNSKDRWGKTALDSAIDSRRVDCINILQRAEKIVATSDEDDNSDNSVIGISNQQDEAIPEDESIPETSEAKALLSRPKKLLSSLAKKQQRKKDSTEVNSVDGSRVSTFGSVDLSQPSERKSRRMSSAILQASLMGDNSNGSKDSRLSTTERSDSDSAGGSFLSTGSGTAGGSAVARAICSASCEGNTAEIKRLIAKGGDPSEGDFDGRTPLHLAAANGFMETVQYLLTLNEVNINAMDRWQSTPVGEAERNNHFDIAAFLYDNGAISISRYVGSQLCKAAAQGDMEKLRDFKSKNIDFNTGDYDSRCAIHLAASNGHLDVVKFLVEEAGAMVSPKDRFGGTPLDDARREGHSDISRYLRLKVMQSAGKGNVRRGLLMKGLSRRNLMADTNSDLDSSLKLKKRGRENKRESLSIGDLVRQQKSSQMTNNSSSSGGVVRFAGGDSSNMTTEGTRNAEASSIADLTTSELEAIVSAADKV